ncbi:radical SAM/SPASM domain-containing protein [Thermoproteota archaeon]
MNKKIKIILSVISEKLKVKKALKRFIQRIRILKSQFFFDNIFETTKGTKGPLGITLEITHNCNLKCLMCPRRSVDLKSNNHLSLDKFNAILEKMSRLSHVNIVSLGEPLLNPNFFDMLNAAKSKGIKVSFTTNAMLLDESSIKRLPDNVTGIFVSIDNPLPEKYKEIRQGASLETVLKNLKMLKQLRRDISLGLQAILMRDNIDDMPGLFSIAEELDAETVSLLHILSLDKINDERHVHNLDPRELNSYLEKIEGEAKKFKNFNFSPRPSQPELKPCPEPWLTPYIAINGDIYPCCFIYRIPKPTFKEWYLNTCIDVPLDQYKMGNIFNDSFEKIWNGKNYRLIRKTIKESDRNQTLSIQEFNRKRKEINLEDKFSYCKICLYRWSSAC